MKKTTSELRKKVSSLFKNGDIQEIGNRPAQPSKVIYNLKKLQLECILGDLRINWDSLQETVWRCEGKPSPAVKKDESLDGDGDTASGDTDIISGDDDIISGDPDDESPMKKEEIQKMLDTLKKTLDDNSRQYVTSTGLIQAGELYADLGLNSLADEVAKVAKVANNALITANNSGGGNIKITVGNSPVIKLKNEHLHPAFERIVFHLKHDNNVYLFGASGAGKTTTAIQISKALGLKRLACYSCSAGMSESIFTGRPRYNISNGEMGFLTTEFIEIWENGGLILLDEFDAIDGNCAIVLNSALANGWLHVPNRTDNPKAQRHKDCYVLGAGNTDGCGNGSRIYAGRNKLDGATLDRFTALRFDYDAKLEKKLSGGHSLLNKAITKLRKNADKYEIQRVISTRAFLRTAGWMSDGKDLKYCLNTVCESWTEFETEKAELSTIIADFSKDAKAVESVKVV